MRYSCLTYPHWQATVFSLAKLDVVLVGYFTQLVDFSSETGENCPLQFCFHSLTATFPLPGRPLPLLYVEQGHEHVFGDVLGSAQWDRWFHAAMHLPVPVVSVSEVISRILHRHFGRIAPVVPNGIDCAAWKPEDPEAQAAAKSALAASVVIPPSAPRPHSSHVLPTSGDTVSILLIGNPLLPMKNSTTALNVLNRVHMSVPNLVVTWVCQVMPPTLSGVTFPIRAVVDPPQVALAALYGGCGHRALLFTSVYEGWGMPVLEAMACGLPVVSSRCHGVDMFAVHGENCLLADPFDVEGLAQHVLRIINEVKLARMLASGGLETAAAFTWDRSIVSLEHALRTVSSAIGPGLPAGFSS